MKLFSDKKKQANGKIEFEVDALEVCVHAWHCVLKCKHTNIKKQWKRQ